MAFTLVGWNESQDSAVLVNIAALPDPHVRVVGDDIVVPALANLAAYYFLGEYFTLGRLLSPSLRRLMNIDVEPADRLAEPASIPALHDLFEKPIPLVASEGLNAQAAEDGSGGQYSTALAWLSDGPIAPVVGEMRTVRATAAVTCVGYAWTNGALTFDQTLPAGRYQIVGMRAQSATLIAARLVFPGMPWRPGVIGCDSDADLGADRFRYGKAGVFGEFDHDAPPTVDFLAVTTDSSEVVHLDLIKIA